MKTCPVQLRHLLFSFVAFCLLVLIQSNRASAHRERSETMQRGKQKHKVTDGTAAFRHFNGLWRQR